MSDQNNSAPTEHKSATDVNEKRGFFDRFRRNRSDQPAPDSAPEAASDLSASGSELIAPHPQPVQHPDPVSEPPAQPQESLRERMRRAMSRTSQGFGRALLGEKKINDELFEELETLLLLADVGVENCQTITRHLADRVKRRQLNDSSALYGALKEVMLEILKPCSVPLQIDSSHSPFVILVVGVNGVGKTTTIGKLAKNLQNQGKTVMLAAGDTFRAAAVEQLQTWGERNGVQVVAQHTGADSASVVFDAVQSAQSRNIDVVIADTAGRLHNKSNLMAELEKVKRVMAKLDASAPHEVLLVLDAGTGQNAVSQLTQFDAAVGVTGIALTKLDGTAKGGVAFALSQKHGIPIRYIGIGEGIDDLQPFDATAFVDAMIDQDD